MWPRRVSLAGVIPLRVILVVTGMCIVGARLFYRPPVVQPCSISAPPPLRWSNQTSQECGSCYGAESKEQPCCNSCDEVREAFRRTAKVFDVSRPPVQCQDNTTAAMAGLANSSLSDADAELIEQWRRSNRGLSAAAKQWSFFHIPKTAGNSLTEAIFRAARAANVSTCRGHANAETHCNRSTAGQITGHQYYSPTDVSADPEHLRYFTLLRHPVNRVVSLYHFIRHEKDHHQHAEVQAQTLAEFASSNEEAHNVMATMLCGHRGHWRCKDDAAYATAQAKRHLSQSFGSVGIQECYGESIQLLEASVPWMRRSNGLHLLHENVVSSKTAPVVGAEIQRLILEHNQMDYEIYRFGVGMFLAARADIGQHADDHIIDGDRPV